MVEADLPQMPALAGYEVQAIDQAENEASEELLSLQKNQSAPSEALLLKYGLVSNQSQRKEDFKAVLKRMSPENFATCGQRIN